MRCSCKRVARHLTLNRCCCCCRDNVEDALTKMQKAIDSAAKSIIPKAPDLVKKKKIDKQCVPALKQVLQRCCGACA